MGIGRIAGLTVLALIGAPLLLVSLKETPKPPPTDWGATLREAQEFERKWLAAKAAKDGAIQYFDYTAIVWRIKNIPDDNPIKVEAIAVGERLKGDEALIKKVSDAHFERQAALDEKQRREAAIKQDKENLPVRKQYGRTVERFFLDQGMDVYVQVEGAEARTLRLKYILMSRPLVHQIQNNDKTIATWRALGFRRVVLTDGYNQTWSLDLR